MTVFVDTSAFYAILDVDDDNHRQASDTLKHLREARAHLVTSNYVIAESCGLIQRRLGMKVAGAFRSHVLPIVKISWVDEYVHEDGFNYFLTCGRGGPSFVDSVSFAVMRNQGTDKAFAFDKHFSEQGFERIP
jgi:predicted nucleic acid-binding protein